MKLKLLLVVVAGSLTSAALVPPSSAAPGSAAYEKKAEEEVGNAYAKAHPEIREYVIWTARSFGRGGLWLPEDAMADLAPDAREEKIRYLAKLFADSEYGRHLCTGLAEASALRDRRLLPGLMKVAGFHQADRDYDCRAKWMAVAALARQEADEAVPLLISLVDHGNQNTRKWARAALFRQTQQDFKEDKQRWAQWWQSQGHERIAESYLQPYKAPKPAEPAPPKTPQ